MNKLPAFLRESLTYDRDREMACRVALANRINIDILFADPYAPWQRGSNENSNSLLRKFLSKGTDLSAVSQAQMNDIAKFLNGRSPRDARLDTPEDFTKRIALDS